ncbi:Coniferyl aldehyde dehydrogenase [invertebrate metagenome]|uniref:Coniferyl aldehyde dehydrogenase n=1 Tax=invertebrate metagenome TaxID=1711999 RepID=A0A2H9TBU6_9ZZZZ
MTDHQSSDKTNNATNSSVQEINALFQQQRTAYNNEPSPSADIRKQRLKQLQALLRNNRTQIIQAISQDFGHRSAHETKMAEFMPSLEGIKYTLKHLKKWMQPSKRRVGIQLQPASAKVLYQPLGVVGIIVPWNYPLFLTISPLTSALAAGNRVMIKLSEYTPVTSHLLTQLINNTFPDKQVVVINGDAETGARFSALPFDHLLFTGSTTVGKHIMEAASKNLTPLTLELGGKSPVIIDQDFPIKEAAERICFGKSLNAGQTCIAPDYVLLHKEQIQAFTDAYLNIFSTRYPDIEDFPRDYSTIINEKQYQRLQAMLADAKMKGATIETVEYPLHKNNNNRIMPVHLILNPADDMQVMQEEIFGPLLPVIAIKSLDDAFQFIQNRPRPLSLYYFGYNKQRQNKVLQHTHSGSTCINDTVTQAAVEDMPFGGIGSSGMGHYHGHEGFRTFSHARSVLKKGRINSTRIMYPPYRGLLQQWVLKLFS